uniref:Chloride channel protein n=1 Tax=Pyrodinium bahamense TaxID=73915 RepID=A0A7S0A9A2_9DINO
MGVCLILFVAPNCGSSGLPENKCYLNGSDVPGFFTRRTLRVRVLTTILANAAGFPVGREGPTVVIGSNVAYLISQALAGPYVQEWVDLTGPGAQNALMFDTERFASATRIACGVGGACGMAMIFNAPFGGLLYMFEEITSVSWPLELTFRVFIATLCCAFVSYGLLNLYGSDIKEFVIYAFFHQKRDWEWTDMPAFIAVAALLGVLTSYHTRGMLAFAAARQRMAAKIKKWKSTAKILETVFYCSLCALLSALVSLLADCVEEGTSGLQYVAFNCPEGTYNPIASLLVNTSHSSVKLLFSGNNVGEIHWGSSLLAFATYFSLNVGLTGLPVPGGAFTATMLLGGLFGRAVGALGKELGLLRTASGVYGVVGSAAMLCGFKQMTLAVVLIVVECVNDLALAPVVMLSVAVSMLVNWSINERGHDEEQIERKNLPFLEGEAPEKLDDVQALSLCDPLCPEAVLPPEASVEKIRKALAATQERGAVVDYPIVDDSGSCVGIVTRSKLEAALQVASGEDGLNARRPSRAFEPNPFQAKDDKPIYKVDSLIGMSKKEAVPLDRIMDPTPFMIVEDMPAPRLYALFAKAGERCACVTSRDGRFRGLISRLGLISAARHGLEGASSV